MNDEQIAAACAFITLLLGEEPLNDPEDEWWWTSDDATTSRHGKPLTGWYVAIRDDSITMQWEDITPESVLHNLYAIVGYALINRLILNTPQVLVIPPSGKQHGFVRNTNSSDDGE